MTPLLLGYLPDDFSDRRANRKSIFQGRSFGILDGIFFSAATISDISGYMKFDEGTRISDTRRM
jgi:hypothetical protein